MPSRKPTVPAIPKKLLHAAERKKDAGNRQYKAQNYKKALKWYNDALSLLPNSVTYLGNKAACNIMLKDYKAALNDSKQAIELDQTFEKGYIRIARCSLFMGDINGAEQIIKKFLELHPNSKALDGEQKNCKNFREIVNITMVAYDKKEYARVLPHIDNALKISPDFAKFKLIKAKCLVCLERVKEASDIATSVLRTDSTNAVAVYILGLCFYYQGNLEESIKHFRLALTLNPDHMNANLYLERAKNLKFKKEMGNVLFNGFNYRNAFSTYTEALQIDKLNKAINSKLYFNRALASSVLGNNQSAINDCTLALQINSKYAKALRLRAKCYLALELFDGCISDCKAILKLERSREVEKLLRLAQSELVKSQRKNYYKTLGINKKATGEEIKKAYRKLALVYHPDRHSNATATKIKELENKFKEVGEAFNILSDLRKRAEYDRTMDH